MKYILLLIPCMLALAVPYYNSMEPHLFGIPFFFWYSLVLIPVSVIFIFAADRMEDGQ